MKKISIAALIFSVTNVAVAGGVIPSQFYGNWYNDCQYQHDEGRRNIDANGIGGIDGSCVVDSVLESTELVFSGVFSCDIEGFVSDENITLKFIANNKISIDGHEVFRCNLGVTAASAQAQNQENNFNLERIKRDAEAQSANFVFKSFYLGMPIEDAQGLINHHLGLNQVSQVPVQDVPKSPNESPISDKDVMRLMFGSLVDAAGSNDPYRIFAKDNLLLVTKSKDDRPFAVSGRDGRVIAFELSESVQAGLFDSKGMSKEMFLRDFMSAYKIPSFEDGKIKIMAMGIEEIAQQTVLSYTSENGFQVVYYGDIYLLGRNNSSNLIFASYVPTGSITITKSKTASERKSKFD